MKNGTIKLTCVALGLGAPVVMVAISWGAVVATVATSSGAVEEIEQVPGPARTAVAVRSSCDELHGVVPTEETLLDLVRPLPPDVEVREWFEGSDGALAASEDGTSRLVYGNTLGKFVFGPPLANLPFADDITTTAVHGCLLDRYVITVSGDAAGYGSGIGPYAVDVALYETCPGASGLPSIWGTATHVDFPDNGTYELTVAIPPDVDIPIPSSLYVGVSFDRTNAGIVMGAPALLGFSADRFDYPGFACAAGLGGFPGAAHASFYAEIYVRGDCPESFVGYKNTNHAGNAWSAGSRVYFADDLMLEVAECNMVAFEVAHKGDGFVRVDLHTFLSDSDPGGGGLIPGTRMDCFSSGNNPQICRQEFDPPIPLIAPNPWVVFKSNSGTMGPILTCKHAAAGVTENIYMVHRDGEWGVEAFGDSSACWAGFEVTIYCDGHPPLGACCDMILTDDEGESVCRDPIPEMNCAFPEQWEEGAICSSICEDGVNDGLPCTRQADCPYGECPGPFAHPCGVAACCKPDGECRNMTESECNAVPPLEANRLFQKGQFCYEGLQRCPYLACGNGEGDCCEPPAPFGACVGGDRDGEECDYWAFPSECTGYSCVGGTLDGELCDPDNLDACPDGVCFRAACVREEGGGCGDPICCTLVCTWVDPEWWPWWPWWPPPYSYCCSDYWDAGCASMARWLCECGGPSNDECYDSASYKGAYLVYVPTTVEMDGIRATENEADPGFCCHEDGPDTQGVGTLWFKFVAPPNGECDGGDRNGEFCNPNADDPDNPDNGCPGGTCLALPVSVSLDTCCSNPRPDAPADDSLLQIFAVPDLDRGLCDDGLTRCSVSAQDCADGSTCVFDEQRACSNLMPIACSDDAGAACACGPNTREGNSKVCVPDLVPGNMYYVMIGAKSEENKGIWQLRIASPCSPDLPPLHNDLCMNAEQLTGTYAKISFDLSGELFGEAPATFDCPGPPLYPVCLSTMQNDIWYDWIAPSYGTLTVQTCGGSDALTPDTSLVVYDGCECPVGLPMEQREGLFACSDFQPTPCFLGSKLSGLEVEVGHCYKIRLGGNLGDTPAGTLTIGLAHEDCPEGPVTFLDPPGGVVDARQPHRPADPLDAQGLDTFLVEAPAGADCGSGKCWSLCETATGEEPNDIVDTMDNGDGTMMIHLARPITTGAVTTITYMGMDAVPHTGVFTAHPGNVNGDNRTSPADILFLIDVLNGVRTAPWGMYSTDCDHSGETGPADILCVINLLNGAGAYEAWLDTPLPTSHGCEP